MTDMEMAADLGLRIEHEPYSNGIKARAVYRGPERIYHDEPAGVRHYLKGYAAAGLTAYELLTGALAVLEDHGYVDEELIACIRDFDGGKESPTRDKHIQPAAKAEAEGENTKPADRCSNCDKPASEGELIDSGWLYGALCGNCAEDALETIEHELRALAGTAKRDDS